MMPLEPNFRPILHHALWSFRIIIDDLIQIVKTWVKSVCTISLPIVVDWPLQNFWGKVGANIYDELELIYIHHSYQKDKIYISNIYEWDSVQGDEWSCKSFVVTACLIWEWLPWRWPEVKLEHLPGTRWVHLNIRGWIPPKVVAI